MRVQFASGRQQLPISLSNFVVSSGGTVTTPQTLYFALQGENPAGLNLLSSIVGPVTVNPGQILTITLPTAIHGEGEYWLDYVISASTSNDPTTFVQLAKVPADRLALPMTVVLDHQEHFARSATAANAAALPSGVALQQGMMRGLGGYVYEYDAFSSLTADGTEVIAASPSGRWIRKSVTFSTYLAATTDLGGCDRSIRSLNASLVRTPRYACNGSNSEDRVFWIRPSVGTLPAGDRVGVTVAVNDTPQSGAFEGMLRLSFLGYADTADGTLRTETAGSIPFYGVGEEVTYDNERSDLTLPDTLAEDEAYTLAISANFRPQYLRYGIPNNAILSVEPFLYSTAGVREEAGWALGDWIYPVEGQYGRVCLPGEGSTLIAEKGSGMVARRSFLGVGPDEVGGLASNTADQVIRINGNGAVYVGSGTPLSTEAVRCYVSTVSGTGFSSPWSDSIFVNGSQGLSITLTYPYSGGYATVRSDYPDPSIAGLARASLNPPQVTVYVESTIGGTPTIRKFTGIPLVEDSTQVITLSNWTAGTNIGSLPEPSDPYFGLFEPVSAAAVASGSGSFPNGSIRVAYAFEYDGTAVCSIDHQRSDCIHQGVLTLAEIEEIGRAVAPSVDTFADLRAVAQAKLWPGQRRYVLEANEDFRWNATSTDADDGSTVIKPDWLDSSDPGRHVLIQSGEGGGSGSGVQVAATQADLRSGGTATTGELWYGTWAKDLFTFDPDETATDNNEDVIKPTVVVSGPGRFISQTRRVLRELFPTIELQLPDLGEAGFTVFGSYPSGWAQIPGGLFEDGVHYDSGVSTLIDISNVVNQANVQQFVAVTWTSGSSGNVYDISPTPAISSQSDDALFVVVMDGYNVQDENGDFVYFEDVFEIRRTFASAIITP